MTDERKTLRPPPIPRRDAPERPKPEPIARVALRAPQKSALSDQEALLQALQAHEATLQREFSAQRAAFEDKIRQEMRAIVTREAEAAPSPSVPPPASARRQISLLPPKGTELAWFPHLPALVVALGALVTSITQSCGKKAELSTEAVSKITAVDERLTKHITSQRSLNQANYNAALELRDYVSGIFEETLNVKIDDPLGAPRRRELTYYPSPLSSNRPPLAPLVQPHAPFPVPPNPEGY